MKKMNAIIFCLLTIVLLSTCDSNKKLEQTDAEKAIKEFVQTNSFGGGGSWGQQGSFDVNSISSIEPIIQFNELEASSAVHFNYQDAFSDGNMNLKFNFKRDIDKKWVLTSVEAISGVGSQGMSDRLQKWQNINVMVVKSSTSDTYAKANENQAKYTDIDEFLTAFKQAVKSKDKKEISKFMYFPFDADNGIEPAKTIEEVDSRIGISSFDAVLNVNTLQKYGDNDYGIPGTSLKFSKHSNGYWKLDAAYGSPDFYR